MGMTGKNWKNIMNYKFAKEFNQIKKEFEKAR